MMGVDLKLRGASWVRYAQGVTRWHTLAMAHRQSLVDHMYATAMLAEEIYPGLPDVAFRWALVHDLDELLTGDTPGHFKREVREAAPVSLSNIEAVTLEFMPVWWQNLKNEFHKTCCMAPLSGLIVKLADVADQLAGARCIIDPNARGECVDYLHRDLHIRMADIENALDGQPTPLMSNWKWTVQAYAGVPRG